MNPERPRNVRNDATPRKNGHQLSYHLFTCCENANKKQNTNSISIDQYIAGKIAHDTLLVARGLRQSHYRFAHGAWHILPDGLILADSYHCSRYNTNTGRLTEAMFHDVFAAARERLG